MMAGVGSGAAPRPHCSQSGGPRAAPSPLCTFEVGLAEDGVTWKLQRTPPARSIARAHCAAQPAAAPSERDAHRLGLERVNHARCLTTRASPPRRSPPSPQLASQTSAQSVDLLSVEELPSCFRVSHACGATDSLQPSAAAWDAAKRKLREAKALWQDTYTEDSRHTTSSCHTTSTASLSSYHSLRDLEPASSLDQQQDQVHKVDAKRMSTGRVWHGTGTSESPEEVAYQAAKSADDTEACLFGRGKAAGIFKTGSGIPIRVSAAAKRRAHEILQSDEDGEAYVLHEPLSGFKTGMADAIVLQPENAKQQLKSTSMFTSGSGRSIEVSEASLKRARCLLDIVDDTDQKEQDVGDCVVQEFTKDIRPGSPEGTYSWRNSMSKAPTMFSTASGLSLSVSADSLARAKKLLEQDESNGDDKLVTDQAPKTTQIQFPSGAVHESAILLLTDGWYQIRGRLDTPLTNLLHQGKIFVGQKLRAYPEACLLLHMNCTYRAHWADKLGLCKRPMPPLALHRVKDNGGVISSTFVTVTRIYPMLYWQRQANGQGVMRSEKAEDAARCQHEERRTRIAESTLLTLRKDDDGADGHPNEEDSKDFANVKAEEAVREALENENLGDRDVSPMLRLRVSNLGASKHDERYHEGLISIWRPHDEQQKGDSTTNGNLWHASAQSRQQDGEFCHHQSRICGEMHGEHAAMISYFETRKATPLTSLTKSLIGREFDTAAFVLHIGEPILGGTRHTQWLFLVGGLAGSDDSTSLDEACILAVEHSAVPEAFVNLESSLNGSTIACCNLLLSKRDVKNSLWVAIASDIGVISGNLLATHFAHLRVEAGFVACSERESATLDCLNKLITGFSLTIPAAHFCDPASILPHLFLHHAIPQAANLPWVKRRLENMRCANKKRPPND
eukprot:SM000101S09288  [mRNA]  locus=s101:335461:341855:- [translate_table: standard]